MRKLIHYLNWDMKNEFIASGYFAAMLFMYIILKLILGDRNIDAIVIIEMFLFNYVMAIINRIVLDDRKDYRPSDFILRGVIINVIAIVMVVVLSIVSGWFEGMPVWSAILLYSMIVIAYVTVWILMILAKKYDTDDLNEQLKGFKKGENN